MLIQGDCNARARNMADYLVSDKSDKLLDIENLEKPCYAIQKIKSLLKRDSCLFDLRNSHDFLIVNGRNGRKYRSFQWNGCRVVDAL